MVNDLARQNGMKQVGNVWPTVLNRRLWQFLLQSLDLSAEMRWNGMQQKTLRRMAAQLTNHVFLISGRNPYKEEFVTCGGVALTELYPATLECKRHRGLYFAGEVTDTDAITGGFNLQAAWTMGYVAAKSCASACLKQFHD